jgi:hypothetical protein
VTQNGLLTVKHPTSDTVLALLAAVTRLLSRFVAFALKYGMELGVAHRNRENGGVRFDPQFLKEEEERKEEKKVHSSVFSFCVAFRPYEDAAAIAQCRRHKTLTVVFFYPSFFGFTEALEDGGRTEESQ